MSKINNLFFILLFIVFFSACTHIKNSQDENIITIKVEIGNTQKISKFENDFQVLSLDTSKLALQGEVRSVIFSNEFIAIHTPNRLSIFDSSGSYLRDIGRFGRAHNEYLRLSSVLYENTIFKLFDSDQQKILKFNSNGSFIDCEGLDPANMYQIHKITSFYDDYITLMKYRGSSVETPSLGLFDKNLILQKNAGEALLSGLTLHEVFSLFQNELLYWNIFDYNIYSIDQDFTVKSKYFIDFGKYSLPKNIYNDVNPNKIMEYALKNETNLIVSIQYVIEQESYISFTFGLDKTCYLAIFNKRNGEIKVYELQLTDDSFVFYPFITIFENNYVLCGYYNTYDTFDNLDIILIKQDLLL